MEHLIEQVIEVSKLVKTMLTSLVIIMLGGIILYVVITNAKANPIDDLVKYSYETPEITTDLQDGGFVRIQFQIVTDGKKAKKEIASRDFQLRNILIKELTHLTEEEFSTGLDDIEKIVVSKLNELMTEGKIVDVYTISKILQ